MSEADDETHAAMDLAVTEMLHQARDLLRKAARLAADANPSASPEVVANLVIGLGLSVTYAVAVQEFYRRLEKTEGQTGADGNKP